MPVITAVSRDDPLKVSVFLPMFQARLLFTWLGLVRSLDFFSREFRKFDVDPFVHTNLVSFERPTLPGEQNLIFPGSPSRISCGNL